MNIASWQQVPNPTVYTTRQPCEIKNEIAIQQQALNKLMLERHHSPATIQSSINSLTTLAVVNADRKSDLILAIRQQEASIKHIADVAALNKTLTALNAEHEAAVENELQLTLVDQQEAINDVKVELIASAKTVCRLYQRYLILIQRHNANGRTQLQSKMQFDFKWWLPHGWLDTTTTAELIKTKSLHWLNQEQDNGN